MEKKIAPSEVKAQALRALLQGQHDAQSGEELLSTLVWLSTERVLQEALEHEQAEALGRGRYEARGEKLGYRNGYENGTLKTGEGVLRVKVPQIRGREEPYRSPLWQQVATTSEVLKRLIVEMYVGGMSQRDIEYSLESAVGQFVLSKSTVSELTDILSQEYETWRTRDLSQEAVAYLFMDTVYEPLRRWGQKTGVLCVWAICEDGRKVLLSLSTTNSESYESCLEVLRGLAKRGLQTPVTITTDRALGLTKAIDAMWPKSLRIRCWFHKMQNLQQKVPTPAWPEFKALVVDMRDAPTVEAATERRDRIVARYQREFPEACRCLLDDAEASLNHLYVPQRHQQYVRTSNLVERAFVEGRRRTKVIPHLFDEGSLVNLVFGVLIRVSERWGKKCFSEFEQQQIRSLRGRLKLDEQETSIAPLSERVSKNWRARVEMSRQEHTQGLRNGCHGAGMATTGTVRAGSQAGRAADPVSPARERQGDLLFAAHGVFLALAAPCLSPLADCFLLFLAVAQSGELGAEARYAARGGAAGPRPPAATECREYR